MGYIRFTLSSHKVGMTISLKSNKFVELPNGVGMFCAELNNGLDLIVLDYGRESRGKDTWYQRFSIFDCQLEMTYKRKLSLIFTVFDAGREHYTFSVHYETDEGRAFVRSLKLKKGESPLWGRESIEDSESRRLWVKAKIGGLL